LPSYAHKASTRTRARTRKGTCLETGHLSGISNQNCITASKSYPKLFGIAFSHHMGELLGGTTTIEQNTRKAYIGYLGRIEWTHFCTLTFRNPVSASTAWNRLKEWLSKIRVRYKRTVSWFAAVEVGEEKERHIHVLLQISPSVTSDALRSQWQAGISHIQKFDPNKPGIYYLTKTLDRDDAEYDLEIFTIEREEKFSNEKSHKRGDRSR